MESYITSQVAKEKADDHWMSRLWPVIWAAAEVGGYLALIHAAAKLAGALPGSIECGRVGTNASKSFFSARLILVSGELLKIIKP